MKMDSATQARMDDVNSGRMGRFRWRFGASHNGNGCTNH